MDMTRRFRLSTAPLILALGALAAPPVAVSDTVVFHLDIPYNAPEGPPAGNPPWLRAVFSDVAGGVELELISLLQSETEFVTEWYFNLDPALNPNLLTITHQSGVAPQSIATGENAFFAPGDGRFDILIDFPSGPPASRFQMGSTSTLLITSTEAISAQSFNFFSVPGPGGQPGWLSVAHVQGIDGEFSAHISAIPEPTSMVAMALGLVSCGLAGVARRRRRAVVA